MSTEPAGYRPRLARREAIRIGLIVVVGLASGVGLLAWLMPSRDDVRFALALALGRSPREINEDVLHAPLPPAGPGPHGPTVLPRPPRRFLAAPPDFSAPPPFPDNPNPRWARELEMQRRQYEFYAREVQRFREEEARATTEGGACAEADATTPGSPVDDAKAAIPPR